MFNPSRGPGDRGDNETNAHRQRAAEAYDDLCEHGNMLNDDGECCCCPHGDADPATCRDCNETETDEPEDSCK